MVRLSVSRILFLSLLAVFIPLDVSAQYPFGKNKVIYKNRDWKVLKTDHVDVLLIHSCEEKFLRNADLIEALQECKDKGLARFIGYSGDRGDVLAAMDMGFCDVVEMSVNICDQQVLEKALPRAKELGLGVIAKRPLANTGTRACVIWHTMPYQQRCAMQAWRRWTRFMWAICFPAKSAGTHT